jgi:hypothetical protein
VSNKRKRKPKPQPEYEPNIYQEECQHCDDNAQRWQWSLENLAGDALSMRAYWTKLFGDWEKFAVPGTTATLAKLAAEEWAKLAQQLAPDNAPAAEPIASKPRTDRRQYKREYMREYMRRKRAAG